MRARSGGVVRGLRSILALPGAYRSFARLIGAHSARAIFAAEYVRPLRRQRILDIGCGPGDLVPYLAGAEYVGFDSSAEYVASARATYGGIGASFVHDRVGPHLVGRFSSFDTVIASGVVHHLDDADAIQLFEIAHASLRPGGRIVTFDGCYADGQGALARAMLSHDRGRYVRSAEEYVGLASKVFPDVRATVRHDLLRIPYTHVIVEGTRARSP
jgi:SAM-dependent methyltransferase